MFASGAGGQGSNSEQIKSHTYQRLATAATSMCGPWRKAAKMLGISLVTPERVLSEYNED